MALTEIVVADMALSRIGISRQLTDVDGTLANSTDTGKELPVCVQWYERCRNKALETFPWTFARAYTTLVLNDDGDGEIWTDEWDNAYDYPADCLKIRRFVNDRGVWDYGLFGQAGGTFPVNFVGLPEWRYEVKILSGSKVIMTDVAEADADIEYTQLITDATLYTEQFASALAWQLAAEIATPLSVDLKRREDALRMYSLEMQAAAASMLNEEIPRDEDPDLDFINARGFF